MEILPLYGRVLSNMDTFVVQKFYTDEEGRVT